jgi:hypothetical protein
MVGLQNIMLLLHWNEMDDEHFREGQGNPFKTCHITHDAAAALKAKVPLAVVCKSLEPLTNSMFFSFQNRYLNSTHGLIHFIMYCIEGNVFSCLNDCVHIVELISSQCWYDLHASLTYDGFCIKIAKN